MNIYRISKQADQMVRRHFGRLFNIYLLIEVLLLLMRSIPNDILVLLFGVVSVTLSHAYVVTSLKLIDHQETSISLKDAFVGITQFSRLFPSYIMRKVTLNTVSFLLVVPTILYVAGSSSLSIADFLGWVRLVVVDGMENLSSLVSNTLLADSIEVMISLVISSVLSAILSYGFAMIPYLVERFDISWNEAMMKSWKMMKGHKRDLLLLQFIYVPRYLFYYLIIALLGNLVPAISLIFQTLVLILIIYLPILLWVPQLQVATALFYEELISQQPDKGHIFEL